MGEDHEPSFTPPSGLTRRDDPAARSCGINPAPQQHYASGSSIARPCEELADDPAVHYTISGDTTFFGPLAAVALPCQLARRVGVRVDGEQAAEFESQLDQSRWRIPTFWPGIDLDGGS